MPGLDGTGPRGMGPMTGGGRGWCASYGSFPAGYAGGGFSPWMGAWPRAYPFTGGFGPFYGAMAPFRPMGLGMGFGRGMGWGMGLGRGMGWGMGRGRGWW
jgi:protein crumbs